MSFAYTVPTTVSTGEFSLASKEYELARKNGGSLVGMMVMVTGTETVIGLTPESVAVIVPRYTLSTGS